MWYMRLGERVRAFFSMGSRPSSEQFSAVYMPINTLIEGLFRGIGYIGRREALGVPAVLRGRNMIAAIGTLPLQAVDADFRIQDHPLLRQIDPNVPNVVTLSQTVEDLLFDATAWWRITAFGWDGYPVEAVRYDPAQVSVSPPAGYDQGRLPSGLPTTGVIWMAGEPVPHSEVIRFDSPNPALLVSGQRAIRRAIALDKAADMYADTPQARGFFSPVDGVDPGSDDEINAALDTFQAARSGRLYGYVPAAVKFQQIQDPTPAELQILAQQQRVDLQLANAMGIDPEDLGINTTSRTYQNATDRRKDRINDVLAPYMTAITGRLSMPDVTKRGVTVRFSLDDYLKADPLTRAQVQQSYVAMGAISPAEVRVEEGIAGPAPRAPQLRPAVPSQTGQEPTHATVGAPEPARQIEAA